MIERFKVIMQRSLQDEKYYKFPGFPKVRTPQFHCMRAQVNMLLGTKFPKAEQSS